MLKYVFILTYDLAYTSMLVYLYEGAEIGCLAEFE